VSVLSETIEKPRVGGPGTGLGVSGLVPSGGRWLPLTGEGYTVDAVLISSDFSPPVVTAQMWVPRGSGRSSPYREGRRDESGPVALKVRAPALPKDAKDPSITARARLSIYYENNLLQSAVVKVGVVGDPNVTLVEKNAIEMDFALTGSFQNLEARYASRELVARVKALARATRPGAGAAGDG